MANTELEMLKMVDSEEPDLIHVLKCHFTESSSSGEHVCIGVRPLGGSVEAVRLSSPTKTLPTHVVQKAIGSMIIPLKGLHRNSVAHGGKYCVNLLSKLFRLIGRRV